MANLKPDDLSTWILIEAYRNGSGEREPRSDKKGAGPGRLASFRISCRAIYEDYFGSEENPGAAAPGAPTSAEAPRLARLKKTVVLARSVKQLLAQRLIALPAFSGLTTGIRHVPSVYAEYLYLTEHGVHEAESILADISV